MEEQIKQIRYFIDKKMDVIVVIAIDDIALKDTIAEAKKEGIKVIAYDRPIRDANVDLYLSVDNERVGELMAEYIKKKIGNEGRSYRSKDPLPITMSRWCRTGLKGYCPQRR